MSRFSSRFVALAISASLIGLVAATSAPVCCQVNGVAQTNCTCIDEGTGIIAATVPAGAYARYHFLLNNYSVIGGTCGREHTRVSLHLAS